MDPDKPITSMFEEEQARVLAEGDPCASPTGGSVISHVSVLTGETGRSISSECSDLSAVTGTPAGSTPLLGASSPEMGGAVQISPVARHVGVRGREIGESSGACRILNFDAEEGGAAGGKVPVKRVHTTSTSSSSSGTGSTTSSADNGAEKKSNEPKKKREK